MLISCTPEQMSGVAFTAVSNLIRHADAKGVYRQVKGKAFPLDVFIAAHKAQDFDMASMTEQQLQPQAHLKLSSSKLALFGVAATPRHRPIIGAEDALAKVRAARPFAPSACPPRDLQGAVHMRQQIDDCLYCFIDFCSACTDSKC